MSEGSGLKSSAPLVSSFFVYVTTHPGAEAALKKEIAEAYPELKLGFSKKGFLTFKSEKKLFTRFRIASAFAQSYGLHLETIKGMTADSSEFKEKLSEIETKAGSDAVLETIWIKDDQCFVGLKLSREIKVELPANSPSRAYLKLAEAFLIFKPKTKPNDTFLEIGSSPGGMSFFLLEKGFHVIGVDSGEMNEICLKNDRFLHLKKSAAHLAVSDWADLESGIQWLVMDVNLKAEVAIAEMKKVLPLLPDLRGVFLTLKMATPESYLKLESFLARIAALGMREVSAAQLPSNKQEVCVFARA